MCLLASVLSCIGIARLHSLACTAVEFAVPDLRSCSVLVATSAPAPQTTSTTSTTSTATTILPPNSGVVQWAAFKSKSRGARKDLHTQFPGSFPRCGNRARLRAVACRRVAVLVERIDDYRRLACACCHRSLRPSHYCTDARCSSASHGYPKVPQRQHQRRRGLRVFQDLGSKGGLFKHDALA